MILFLLTVVLADLSPPALTGLVKATAASTAAAKDVTISKIFMLKIYEKLGEYFT